MSDIEIFSAELTTAAAAVRDASHAVVMEAAHLTGDDVGIENPAYRPSLRLEVHRRLTALQAAARERAADADGVAARAQRIADRYSELDAELSGTNGS